MQNAKTGECTERTRLYSNWCFQIVLKLSF